MKRGNLLLWLAAAALIGCTDSPTQPSDGTQWPAERVSQEVYSLFRVPLPDVEVPVSATGFLANQVITSVALSTSSAEDLVAGLFPRPGLSRAASVQLRNIWRDVVRGNDEEALIKARYFMAFTLAKLNNGQLNDPNGAAPPTTTEAVALLLNGVFEFVGVPGGQVLGLSRNVYGSSLIDGVDSEQFPRGGAYLATISGVGVENATGVDVDNPHVFAYVVESPGPGLVTVMIGSDAVGGGETHLAPIPDVPFLLTADLSPGVPLAIGNGTFDVIKGPKPVATRLEIVGSVTELPRGQVTAIDFEVDVSSAGNLKFMFIGCALCAVEFTGFGGDQFEHNMTFTITWDVPIDYGWPQFGLSSGGVNGADEEGRLEIDIPVVGP